MSKCCPLYPRKMGYSACQLVDSWKIWGAALQADGETRSAYAASSIRRRSAAWTILLDMRARSCGKRGWRVSWSSPAGADTAGCSQPQGPSGASPARSLAHRTPGATIIRHLAHADLADCVHPVPALRDQNIHLPQISSGLYRFLAVTVLLD